MIVTRYKPEPELRQLLHPYPRLAILSCDGCAAQSGTGGVRGMRHVAALARAWDHQVTAQRTISACCPVPIVETALARFFTRESFDALVVLSCAGGIQAACQCAPGVPVLGACDTVGVSAVRFGVQPADPLLRDSLCSSCGHCVLGLTGGICPRSLCPLERAYGPCAGGGGEVCVVNPDQECVWHMLAGRGVDLPALAALEDQHHATTRPARPAAGRTPRNRHLLPLLGRLGSRWPPVQ